MIYGFGGKAYNVNGAGNLIWGGAMAVFGHTAFHTYASAHAGTLVIDRRLDELGESAATFRGARYMNSINIAERNSLRQFYRIRTLHW